MGERSGNGSEFYDDSKSEERYRQLVELQTRLDNLRKSYDDKLDDIEL
jgi:hypothetical protein